MIACAWPGDGAAQRSGSDDAPVVAPSFTALAEDGARYADRYGVTLDVAEARLRAQAGLGEFVDRIRAAYADRLAGIAVEHRPQYRVVVLLAGGDPVPSGTVVLAGLGVPVVYRNDAVATIETIRRAIVRHQADIRAALVDPPGLGVDQRTGALVVTVSGRDASMAGPGTLEGAFSKLTGVPVEIMVPGPTQNLALAGGERLDATDPIARHRYTCTAGFTVTNGTQTAISTAAHCPDRLTTAGGVPLALLGAWGSGSQDVQIHRSPTPPMPAFQVGTEAVVRPVTGVGTRARTVAGDFVCHQGYRRGESCAEVVATDFAPPGDLCAGPCPPDWVAVAGPECEHGDSGGPVFDGTIALGIFKGASFRDGRCSLYYYMSLDALPPGWSVLIGRAEGTAAPSDGG